ncbi:MAG: histidine phosphatase family protein [Gammaproteobacteria bacterium]|nr:histidine phosphatase family protein [Gammaproteobacteria bacterium]
MSAGAEPGARFDLLRHGEPVGGRRYRGQRDDPLSETGWRQMWAAVGAAPPWTRIISSPLVRCAAFAEALAERFALPLDYEARFKEIGFGSWEGRTTAELEREVPEQLARFRADPVGGRPPGAEPLAEFIARIDAGWGDCVEGCRGESVLIVAHAGTIRAVIARVLALPPAALQRIKVPYAGMARIEIDAGRGASLALPVGQGGSG